MDKVLNLAIICSACGGSGSVADVAMHHAEGLAAQGFAVSLISDSFPARDLPGVRKILVESSNFHWLRRFAHVPREYAFTRATRQALVDLHQAQPLHAVMCHSHPVATLTALPFKHAHGVPYALVCHGDIFDRPKGTYDSRLTWFYQKTTPPAYLHADLVVALSPRMRELALAGGAQEQQIALIPNGIDPAALNLNGQSPTPFPAPGLPVRLLFVGRLSVEKGVDLLIKACGELVRQNVPLSCRIIGDGPLRPSLEDLCRTEQVTHCVEFLGRVPRQDLGKHYQEAHIVVVPSRSDPLPTVVLEAMSVGKVVIGTDVGGIPFMLEDGSGMVVPTESSEAIAEAVKSAVVDKDKFSLFGIYAWQRAQEKFLWERVIETLSRNIMVLVSVEC